MFSCCALRNVSIFVTRAWNSVRKIQTFDHITPLARDNQLRAQKKQRNVKVDNPIINALMSGARLAYITHELTTEEASWPVDPETKQSTLF